MKGNDDKNDDVMTVMMQSVILLKPSKTKVLYRAFKYGMVTLNVTIFFSKGH